MSFPEDLLIWADQAPITSTQDRYEPWGSPPNQTSFSFFTFLLGIHYGDVLHVPEVEPKSVHLYSVLCTA